MIRSRGTSFSSDGGQPSQASLRCEANSAIHASLSQAPPTVPVGMNGWPSSVSAAQLRQMPSEPSTPSAEGQSRAVGGAYASSQGRENLGAAFLGGLVKRATDGMNQFQHNATVAVNSLKAATRAAPPSVATSVPASPGTQPASLIASPPVAPQQSAGTMAAMIFAEPRGQNASQPTSSRPAWTPLPESTRESLQGYEASVRAANLAGELFDSVG